jgi:glucose/arabinose dehydrogenase
MTFAALAALLLAAPPDGFTVREGFEVQVVIPSHAGARFLEFDDKGTLYVSRPQGDVTSYKRTDDGRYEKLGVFISGKPTTHGLCFHNGWMWFTTTGAVFKARDTSGDGVADETTEVTHDVPKGGGHWWRSILVTDDAFYTSIGCSGNITDETATERLKIWRFNLDGSGKALFCSGLRNTEKLRLRPGTTEIWGLDHGSDNFGEPIGDKPGTNQPITDLNPPDEFNRYVQDGFYGHPFVTGNRVPRYEFQDRPDIHALAAKTVPPEWPVGAHWATNGFCFIDPALNQKTKALPADIEGDAIIACHGSWNSTRHVGYCIARIRIDHDPKLGGHPIGLEKLVSTLNASGDVAARPVDCVQAPDGSVLFSSDQPGRVYRLTAQTR